MDPWRGRTVLHDIAVTAAMAAGVALVGGVILLLVALGHPPAPQPMGRPWVTAAPATAPGSVPGSVPATVLVAEARPPGR